MTEALDRFPSRSWGHGPRPILALHCSLAHAGAWAGLAQELGMDGVTLTALDQPGHGRNLDWDGVQDLHSQATAEATELAKLLAGGGQIDLFGHSFGGTLALRIALENPGLVRSLMLVEPVLFAAAKSSPEYKAMALGQTDLPALIAEDRVEAAARFHAVWGTGEALADLPERQQRYIIDRIHLIPATNPALVEDNAHLLDEGRLEGLDIPVLLVEGSQSPTVISAIHRALGARLPRSKRLVIEGAGHMAPITHAAALAPAIRAHLQSA